MEAVINLNEILSWLKKRILLIICSLIGGFAGATGITYFFFTPTYSSSAELIVQSQNEIVNHNLQSEVHANRSVKPLPLIQLHRSHKQGNG